MALFNPSYGLTLAMSIVLGMRGIMETDGAMWCMVISLGIAGLFVPLTVMSAKGNVIPFYVGVALYFADFVYAFFLFGKVDALTFVMLMVLHAAFLIAYGLGIFFYYRADALLKEHPDILRQ